MVESSSHYRKTFIKQLVNYSRADNYNKALEEWQLSEVRIAEEPHECICTNSILTLCTIQNMNNGISLIIGTDCCKHINESMNKQALIKKEKLQYPEKFCNLCYNKMKKVRNKDEYKCKECEILKDNGNIIMTCGKYKNKKFNYILKRDKSYCKWVQNNNDLYGILLEFKNYVRSFIDK